MKAWENVLNNEPKKNKDKGRAFQDHPRYWKLVEGMADSLMRASDLGNALKKMGIDKKASLDPVVLSADVTAAIIMSLEKKPKKRAKMVNDAVNRMVARVNGEVGEGGK